MKKTRNLFVASAVLVAGLAAAPAQAEFGVGINVSNNGFGVQGRQTLSPSFDLRFGISGIAYSFDFTYDDIDYDVKQSLAIPEIALDWRPGQGMFRLTLSAAYYNDIQTLDAIPSPLYTYRVGNTYYTGTQIGTLAGKVSWHTGAPRLRARSSTAGQRTP